jgi:tetratricopeptide (TPR) repeat protein
MAHTKRLKAEVLALLCVVLMWAVDLKTHCVPRSAAGALRQVLRVAPNWENGYEALGWVYLGCHDRDKANEAFGQSVLIAEEKAVEADPNSAQARFDLARSYHYGEHDIERAIEQYKAALRIDPNCVGAWTFLGHAYTDIGSHQQAVEALHKAAEIDPEGPYGYAHAHLIEVCETAIGLRPDDPNNYAILGETYCHAKEYPQAIQNLQKALVIDPTCQEAYDWLSECYRDTGRYAQSAEIWKQAKVNLPEWRWPYAQLAWDYNDLGRYEEAIGEWQRIIELKPGIAELNVQLADVYLKAGRHEDAITASKEALRLNPNHVKAHYNLAIAYLHTGKRDLALQEYQVLKDLGDTRAEQLLKLVGENHNGAG